MKINIIRRTVMKSRYNSTPTECLLICIYFPSMAICFISSFIFMFTQKDIYRHMTIWAAFAVGFITALVYFLRWLWKMESQGYFNIIRDPIFKVAIINQKSAGDIRKACSDIECPRASVKKEMREIIGNRMNGYEYRMVTHSQMLNVLKKTDACITSEFIYTDAKSLSRLKKNIQNRSCEGCQLAEEGRCGTFRDTGADFFCVKITEHNKECRKG